MARHLSVLIVAPYAAVRAGLEALLADDPDVEVVDALHGSGDLAETLVRLENGAIDAIIGEPGEEDAPLLVSVAASFAIPLVLLTELPAEPRTFPHDSLPGGALLTKDVESEELSAALRAAAEGLVVFSRGVRLESNGSPSIAPVDGSSVADAVLTTREREVLQLIANGLPNKVIGARLSISLHTVKFHVASILSKLDAESRTEAVTIGVRRGYVSI